ncbi:UPF0158 family protein [Brevibacterium oceani]|uniref:UPF0158 family protein n=1 Tax=Brevibacterium oceani TaxID=358099 RepID=UPI0015E64159|nr:UPF0158 family protein [Brevibacterium oceani]
MANTWLDIEVELLGGRGTTLWPRPGRAFAVGPSHTFADLAEAVNTAFARWDLGHLSVFTLSDGRVLTDEVSAEEFGADETGPLQHALDFTQVTVAGTVAPGDEFSFTFDLGDNWVHRCSVGTRQFDPVAMFGEVPDRLVAHWGWGAMPDQYGRRWAIDDGTEPVPPEPKPADPMLQRNWPDGDDQPLVDGREVRAATATKDADRLIAALLGRHIDGILQQLGEGLSMALERDREKAGTVALSVINRLTFRGFPGDSELAEALLAKLQNQQVPGLDLTIDIDMLSLVHEGEFDESTGGYIDLRSGEVIDAYLVEYGDDHIDFEDDPDRWISFDRAETKDAWNDMQAFVSSLRNPQTRDNGLLAIEGTGAFRRFRRFVDEHDLGDRWVQLSEDRKYGRARLILAENGIRVV